MNNWENLLSIYLGFVFPVPSPQLHENCQATSQFTNLMRYTPKGTALLCPYTSQYNVGLHLHGKRYIRYLTFLSKWKNSGINTFYCRAETEFRQGYIQLFTNFSLSEGSRYKNHFVATVAFLRNLSETIIEYLLTGNTFMFNECYRVATYFQPRNQNSFLLLVL